LKLTKVDMKTNNLVFLSISVISLIVAFTQPGNRLVFAQLGYSFNGYTYGANGGYSGDGTGYSYDPTGYSFDPTGYDSPVITYFDGPVTSEVNAGFDSRLVPFETLNWSNATTLIDDETVFLQQLIHDGQVYAVVMNFGVDYQGNYNYVTALTYLVDGLTILTAAKIYIPVEVFDLYTGTELMTEILRAGEIINGGSVNDILYGFAGDDSLRGYDGDDILNGGSGVNYVSGGPGNDTAVFEFDAEDYALSRNPVFGFVEILTKEGGSLGVVVNDVESFQFRNVTLDYESLDYWGTFSLVPQSAVQPVYRFYNSVTNTFLYTSDLDQVNYYLEQSAVSKNNVDELSYVLQGSTFEAAHSFSDAVELHSFNNPNTSSYYYTANSGEAENLKTLIADSQSPLVYEGTVFDVYGEKPAGDINNTTVPVYRFYNSKLDGYFWTADDSEILLMEETGAWVNEGIVFYGELIGD